MDENEGDNTTPQIAAPMKLNNHEQQIGHDSSAHPSAHRQEAEMYESPSVLGVPDIEWVHQDPIFKSIRELEGMKERASRADQERKHAEEVACKEGDEIVSATILEEAQEDAPDMEEGEVDILSKQASAASQVSDFKWLSEICTYFERVAGLEKLNLY